MISLQLRHIESLHDFTQNENSKIMPTHNQQHYSPIVNFLKKFHQEINSKRDQLLESPKKAQWKKKKLEKQLEKQRNEKTRIIWLLRQG